MADRPKVVIVQDRKAGVWRDGAGRFKAPPLKPKLPNKRENGNSAKVKP